MTRPDATGVPPPIAASPLPGVVDWPRDEAAHDGRPWEIWWASAILEAGGRRLAAHMLVVHLDGGAVHAAANLADLDRAAPVAAKAALLDPGKATVAKVRLAIDAGFVRFGGAFDDGYTFAADLGDGIGFDLRLSPTRPVLLNGGSGTYRVQGVRTTQYSVGGLAVSGTVSPAGTAAAPAMTVTGRGWYDRQWDDVPRDDPLAFTWFGLCLDDGDTLSVFALGADGRGAAWATIVRPDGTHIVAAATATASDVDRTGLGRAAPRRWTLAIPAMRGSLVLHQTPVSDEARIYTGALDVAGSYEGAAAAGYGFCDIVGPIA